MDRLKKLWELIAKLIETKFFGQLLIKFESGNIVLVKKEETIKI